MKRITFKYADAMSNYEWRTQHCTVESVDECIRIYGLDDPAVDFQIVSVEEDEDSN